MSGKRGKKIAETGEILAFYTSVMRGEEEDASITNRISAADKLLTRNDASDAASQSVEKLDALLAELRQAIERGDLVARGEEQAEVLEEDLYQREVSDECDED